MTLVVVILIGLGSVLIISGIEDSPLRPTFLAVISGKPSLWDTLAGTPPASTAGGQ